jgi:undecaprenyl-diphosphatase
MISYFQAVILGLLQGASELFPISSLGHSVILPRLLGWHIASSDNAFIVFLVATHLATALVLLFFYRTTWVRLIRGFFRSLAQREIRDSDTEAKLGWLLIVGTIPAGILGLLFEQQIRSIFVTARSAAFFLIVNGILLLVADYLRRRAKSSDSGSSIPRLAKLKWLQAFEIGTAQAVALIPGLSRSGASMGGGLLVGLSHVDAAEFAFLLATPIIFAAAILKLPELLKPENAALVGPSIIGGICSALTAYLAVKFLTKYFQTNSLKPFGVYCLIVGATASVLFLR